jgi:Tfp pilus assembly protein PilX
VDAAKAALAQAELRLQDVDSVLAAAQTEQERLLAANTDGDGSCNLLTCHVLLPIGHCA